MITPLQVLSEVRELFHDPSKWTRFANARNQSGYRVEPTDPTAVCWCLNGAIELRAGGYDTSYYRAAFDLLHRVERYPISMNDCDGYEAIIQLLDKAIAHVQN